MSLLDQMSLEGKVAVVTGAGRGLGKEMCLALARAGADVVCVARTASEIDAVAEQVRGLGRRSLAARADVTEPDQVQAVVDRAVAELGQVDVMISNAGGGGVAKPLWETSIEDELRPLLAIDMDTHLYCARAVLKHMVARRRGKIMFSGSAAYWNKGGRYSTIHSIAEAGTANLARSLAITHAEDNIQVHALGIGMFATRAYTEMRQQDPGARPRRTQEAHARFLPAKRYGEPWEIGPYVVYLASDASNYLTGQVVYIDGGVQPAGFAPIDYAPTLPLTRL
ncbi:MAG: SDR family oxidoreductase [Dehalococcoidia bacterium]